jgi:hypothetical protein
MPHKFTPQQIDNIREAIKMWETVPPENVYPELGDWRDGLAGGLSRRPTCKTVACFGGWCAHWPKFRAQGLRADYWLGAPKLRNTKEPFEVADIIFGDAGLFNTRSSSERLSDATDHAIVMNRLKKLLARATAS